MKARGRSTEIFLRLLVGFKSAARLGKRRKCLSLHCSSSLGIRGGYTAGPMRNPAPTNESSQLSEQSAQRDSAAETTEEEEKNNRASLGSFRQK